MADHSVAEMCSLRKLIASGQANELDVLTHGILSGQENVDAVAPDNLSPDQQARWLRGHRIGVANRDPATAREFANPALQNKTNQTKRPTTPRLWEVDNDLIG